MPSRPCTICECRDYESPGFTGSCDTCGHRSEAHKSVVVRAAQGGAPITAAQSEGVDTTAALVAPTTAPMTTAVAARPVAYGGSLNEMPRGLEWVARVAVTFAIVTVIGGITAYLGSGGTNDAGVRVARDSNLVYVAIGAGMTWLMLGAFCHGLHAHLDRIARVGIAVLATRHA